MLYPTIPELTKDQINRYELALATAKCARIITDEYVRQREFAEKSMTGNKETDKPLMSMIDSEYRDEKAVKTAINRIYNGEYVIVERPEGYVPPQREEYELPETVEMTDEAAETASDEASDEAETAETEPVSESEPESASESASESEPQNDQN